MKNRTSFSLSLVLLQVFLLSSAGNAFAFSEPALDLDSRQAEFFKTGQNKKAVFFEEPISEVYLQITSEKEIDFFQFYPNYASGALLLEDHSDNRFSSEFQPDNRRLLKSQIYPFHSFW